MGNSVMPGVACHAPEVPPGSTLQDVDAVQFATVDETDFESGAPGWLNRYDFEVTLDKSSGEKLGLDIDFMSERQVLPIKSVKGGLAQNWNKKYPKMKISAGDSIVKVNYATEDVSLMLELCKCDQPLDLTFRRNFTCDQLVADIRELATTKRCGAALVRLSWQDNVSGCPDAALRHNYSDDPDLNGMVLLEEITEKYCPLLIGHADLWALAASIAISMLGGPEIPVRFGREDAPGKLEMARLDEDKTAAEQLRQIFNHPSMNDRYIVALAGALGSCYDTSTPGSLEFDCRYYKDLLGRAEAATAGKPNVLSEFSMLNEAKKGKPQFRKLDHIMQVCNKALVEDEEFKKIAKEYAVTQSLWFREFAYAWVRFQELGWGDLRMML